MNGLQPLGSNREYMGSYARQCWIFTRHPYWKKAECKETVGIAYNTNGIFEISWFFSIFWIYFKQCDILSQARDILSQLCDILSRVYSQLWQFCDVTMWLWQKSQTRDILWQKCDQMSHFCDILWQKRDILSHFCDILSHFCDILSHMVTLLWPFVTVTNYHKWTQKSLKGPGEWINQSMNEWMNQKSAAKLIIRTSPS